MSADELRAIGELTVKLTELRMKDCPHLCVENIAPEIFGKLLSFARSDIKYQFIDQTGSVMVLAPCGREPYYCSFCGKSQHEVLKLIAGPSVFICDECTIVAMEIVTTVCAGDREYESWNGIFIETTKESK